MKDVSSSSVLQKDSMSGGCFKVEGDVNAGFSLEGVEVKVGGRACKGGCIPVVSFRDQDVDKNMNSLIIFLKH